MKQLLICGLIPVLSVILLNTQDGSVAGSTPLASSLGFQAVVLLDQDVPQEQALHASSGTPMHPAIAASDAKQHYKVTTNEVLQALPAKCRDTLKHFYVKNTKQKNRALAGKKVAIYDGTVWPEDTGTAKSEKQKKEWIALVIHETGHNWDLGCLTGTADSGKSPFADGDEPIYNNDLSKSFYQISWLTSTVKKSNAQSGDFISSYGATNVFEEWSETFAYFVLHNSEFKKLTRENDVLKQKYEWFLQNIFDGKVPQIATGNTPYKKSLWDVTKLVGYVWHPNK